MYQDFFPDDDDDVLAEAQCFHLNNDGKSCHDCFQLIRPADITSFQDSKNYLERRQVGNVINQKDLNGLSIPVPIFNKAQELFQIVIGDKIFRYPTRVGIIAGCIVHSYKIAQICISYKEIVKKMGITVQNFLAGLQKIDLCLYFKDRALYCQLRKNNLTLNQCARELAQNCKIPLAQTINFELYADRIVKKCRVTTAAAVAVWLYIQETEFPLTIDQFSQLATITVNTMKKICQTD